MFKNEVEKDLFWARIPVTWYEMVERIDLMSKTFVEMTLKTQRCHKETQVDEDDVPKTRSQMKRQTRREARKKAGCDVANAEGERRLHSGRLSKEGRKKAGCDVANAQGERRLH